MLPGGSVDAAHVMNHVAIGRMVKGPTTRNGPQTLHDCLGFSEVAGRGGIAADLDHEASRFGKTELLGRGTGWVGIAENVFG